MSSHSNHVDLDPNRREQRRLNREDCRVEGMGHVNGRTGGLIEVKSKLDAEFRRFSIENKTNTFQSFYSLLETFHNLMMPFVIFYEDPSHGDLLPINNDENYAKAISVAKPLLRLFIQRKGEGWEHLSVRGTKKNGFFGGIGNILPLSSPNKNKLSIGQPENFRQVSQILDVDILPETCRRVRLVKHGSDKPLGFYIRDGNSVRVTPQGLVKNHGIFISKLVAGGLAEGTGLLAQNDEVLEVNGIDVAGKTLDQVTDMMVANASNLIITIRPAAQRSLPLDLPHSLPPSSAMYHNNSGNNVSYSHYPGKGAAPPVTRSALRGSGSGSKGSRNSSIQDSDDDEDEVKDHLSPQVNPPPPPPLPPPTSSQPFNSSSTTTTTNNHTSHLQINTRSRQHVSYPNSLADKRNGKPSTPEDENLDDSRFEEVVTL